MKSFSITGLLLLSTLGACQTTGESKELLSLDYSFLSVGDSSSGPVDADTEIRDFSLRYQFLDLGSQFHGSLSYLIREDETENAPKTTVDSDIVRAQIHWVDSLQDGLDVFVGPGAGLAFSVDSDQPGQDFGTGLYLDAEAGMRWYIDPRWGIEGGARYAWLDVEGDRGTRDQSLKGVTLFAGAFLGF